MNDYKVVQPGIGPGFPGILSAQRDFSMEWWYFTGHLVQGENPFGFELTIFRVGITRDFHPGAFSPKDIYFGHLAVTDIGRKEFRYSERSSRGAFSEAGARGEGFHVWIGDWSVQGNAQHFNLTAFEPDFGVELSLEPQKIPVFHGIQGYSRKGSDPAAASYYMSLTNLRAEGSVRFRNRSYTVRGSAWMDREIMTPPEHSEVLGWDWFSIQLKDHRELMLYRLYTKEGLSSYSTGTVIYENGRTETLHATEISYRIRNRWVSPVTRVMYPISWEIFVPRLAIRIRVDAEVDDQELVARRSTGNAYWEGACRVRGAWGEETIGGRAYIEMNREAIPDTKKGHMSD